jgi:AhpD family alkylhydroperoxidase
MGRGAERKERCDMKDLNTLVPGFAAALESVPGTLHAHRRLEKALEAGNLSPRNRAQIGVAVAHQVHCDYCIWIYSRIAADRGVSGEDIVFASAGAALDRREAAVMRLAQRMVAGGILLKRVDCDPQDVGLLSESEVAEVAAHVALAILTCYVLQGLAPSARGRASQSPRAA